MRYQKGFAILSVLSRFARPKGPQVAPLVIPLPHSLAPYLPWCNWVKRFWLQRFLGCSGSGCRSSWGVQLSSISCLFHTTSCPFFIRTFLFCIVTKKSQYPLWEKEWPFPQCWTCFLVGQAEKIDIPLEFQWKEMLYPHCWTLYRLVGCLTKEQIELSTPKSVDCYTPRTFGKELLYPRCWTFLLEVLCLLTLVIAWGQSWWSHESHYSTGPPGKEVQYSRIDGHLCFRFVKLRNLVEIQQTKITRPLAWSGTEMPYRIELLRCLVARIARCHRDVQCDSNCTPPNRAIRTTTFTTITSDATPPLSYTRSMIILSQKLSQKSCDVGSRCEKKACFLTSSNAKCLRFGLLLRVWFTMRLLATSNHSAIWAGMQTTKPSFIAPLLDQILSWTLLKKTWLDPRLPGKRAAYSPVAGPETLYSPGIPWKEAAIAQSLGHRLQNSLLCTGIPGNPIPAQ